MAQTAASPTEPPPSPSNISSGFFRKLFGRPNGAPSSNAELPPESEPLTDAEDDSRPGMKRRNLGKVVPGLPRAQTFKRQQSERRHNLAPAELTADERRAVSVDRRALASRALSQPHPYPRASAPGLLDHHDYEVQSAPSPQGSPVLERPEYSLDGILAPRVPESVANESHFGDDARSYTTSLYDAMISEELESTWILNLSMHFRDRSKREKFFVTYWDREKELWRRVTVSLDYRNAPDHSLEMDLAQTKFQREKSARIYESIRESLQDIQFYDTVTNLKLQTTDGRLHVHVVEDVNEIIPYPSVRQIQHLGCRRVRESDIDFDSHMSGFVYKVSVGGQVLIKKEIPGPETIEEFLYEINALNRLRYSKSVIRFYGVVVDDNDEFVKGLLISYAEQGALIDVLYDNRQDSELGTPWPIRERWARQIVEGLADIHESGFVQGDFTLSNIVIDHLGKAKIIDINRRGCPVGWEPPEATALIESGQRVSMYIGVKSDLYQLGMVLWSLATQEDNPEDHGRPLVLEHDIMVPDWYRQLVAKCLSEDPRGRPQASALISLFPESTLADEEEDKEPGGDGRNAPPAISVDDGYSTQEYCVDGYDADGHPRIRTVHAYKDDWPYQNSGPAEGYPYDPYYYTRGRSPPSPLHGHFAPFDPMQKNHEFPGWAAARDIAPSYSDVGMEDMDPSKSVTPTTNRGSSAMLDPTAGPPSTSRPMASDPMDSPSEIQTPLAVVAKKELGDSSPSDSIAQITSQTHETEGAASYVGLESETTTTSSTPKPQQEALQTPAVGPANTAASGSNTSTPQGNQASGNPETQPHTQSAEGELAAIAAQTGPRVRKDPTGKRLDTTSPETVKQDSLKTGSSSGGGNEDEASRLQGDSGNTAPDSCGIEYRHTPSAALQEEVEAATADAAAERSSVGTGWSVSEASVRSKSPPTPRGSPGAEHPELKGVGAAHLPDDEMFREKLSLDEDFTISTTMTTSATTAATTDGR